jgi:hypothetical protein
MNILSLLNTISYCVLILYAYKDFLATVILYIYTLGCILVSCARCCTLTHLGPFKLNLINGYMQLDPESGPLCCVLEWLTSRSNMFFIRNMVYGASTVLSAWLATLHKDRFIER